MPHKPRIGIMDTSFSSYPFLKCFDLKKLDLFFIGKKKDDYLCNIKNTNFIYTNYASVLNIKNVISKFKLDYVIPGCNDVSFETLTKLQVQQKFSFEVFNNLNNKKNFRLFCKNLNIPTPQIYHNLKNIDCERVIIKPEIGYSGRGISIAASDNKTSLKKGIELAKKISLNKKAIIEEYVSGYLFSLSLFIKKKKIDKFFLVREFCTENIFTVNWSFLDMLTTKNFLKKNKNSLDNFIQKSQINNGLLHLQCMIDKKLNFKIIEATQRCPGDLYPWLIEMQTGYDYTRRYLSEFLPQELLLKRKLTPINQIILRHTSSNYKSINFFHYKHLFNNTLISVPTIRTGELFSEKNKFRSGVHFYATSKQEIKKNLKNFGAINL